jgi:hypothetical protein
MAGLVPAIRVSLSIKKEGAAARHEAGHDDAVMPGFQ